MVCNGVNSDISYDIGLLVENFTELNNCYCLSNNFGCSGFSIGKGGLSIGLAAGTHKETSFHCFQYVDYAQTMKAMNVVMVLMVLIDSNYPIGMHLIYSNTP